MLQIRHIDMRYVDIVYAIEIAIDIDIDIDRIGYD